MADVILVELQPRRAATGATVAVRLAGAGGVTPYYYSGQHYRAGITGLPRIVASLEFDGQRLGGGSVPQALSIKWAASQTAVAELAAYHWTDADAVVRIGPEGALPPAVVTGKVLSATVETDAITLSISDSAAALKQPLLADRFAGTGGLAGPEDWAKRIKPRAFGRVWNVEGQLIDKAANIFCFADPARPLEAITEVRDKGAAAADLIVLGWQGSADATYNALRAAQAPAGGGVACPSIACVKWWTAPAGSLCADLKGETAGGYVETAPEIAQRIVAGLAGVAMAPGTVAAAAAIRPAPVGWYVKDESTTPAAILDELLSDVSLLWALDDSGIVIREWRWGASVASARSLDVTRREGWRPVTRVRFGYRRNQNVLQRAGLAAIVLARDVQLADGTTAQDLQSVAAQALALADGAQDLASGKAAAFWAASPPAADVSRENDMWFDTSAGNLLYRRAAGSGRLAVGGNRITFGGGGLILRPWVQAPDQRIASALSQAAAAITAAATAQATANDAARELDAIAADGVLSTVEKKALVLQDGRLDGAWTALDAAAAQLGVTAERTAAAAARTAWINYRNGLSPSWSAAVDTPIVRTDFQAKLTGYETALATLQRAISAKAATTANWDGVTGTGKDQLLNDVSNAKARVDAAMLSIANIQSDSILAAGEKPEIIRQVSAIQAEYGDIIARATAQGVSSTTYQAAYNALITYLGTLSPAWSNTALDTAIVPGTFNGRFGDYYYARTALGLASADLTAANQVTVTLEQSIEVPADYTGAIAANVLPRFVQPAVKRGGTSITTGAGTSYALSNWTGGCTSANTVVDNTPGSPTKGQVSLQPGWSASGAVDLSIYANNVLVGTWRISAIKKLGAPPSGGGTGSSNYGKSGSFSAAGKAISSATYAEVARISNLAKSAGETIRATFSASYDLSLQIGVSGTRTMLAKWQYAPAGSTTWTDFAAAVNGTAAGYIKHNSTGTNPANPYQEIPVFGDDDMLWEIYPGAITCNQTVAPPDGNYDIRLVACINSASYNAALTISDGPASVAIGA